MSDVEPLQEFEPGPISDREIERQRQLLGVDAAVVDTLATCRGLVEPVVADLADRFYAHQVSIPELVPFFADSGTRARLQTTMQRYVVELFAGRCDQAYVENRLRIGDVHRRIGVTPKYYLAAMRLLREMLSEILLEELRTDPSRQQRVLMALDRMLAFDTALIMDSYIGGLMGQVETARGQLEDHVADLERIVARRTRQLEELARRDPLTGLYNSRALRELLGRDLAHARRRGRPLSVIYFDVDDFKQVNDTRGHRAGDAVLADVGEVLATTCRLEDIPCRYGGDEFCVVAVDADLAQADTLCGRIIEAFRALRPDITFSMGIAQAGPDHYDEPDDLIDRADQQMYRAKKEPGFQVRS